MIPQLYRGIEFTKNVKADRVTTPHPVISPIWPSHGRAERNKGQQSGGRWSIGWEGGLWSLRRQLHSGRAEPNKVRQPSLCTNLVNGNWSPLVTRIGPGTKSSGFSIKQCQILMIFLFPGCRTNGHPLCSFDECLLLSFSCHFHGCSLRWSAIFSAFLPPKLPRPDPAGSLTTH